MRHHRDTLLASRAETMRSAPTAAEARLFEAVRGRKLGVSFRRQVVLGGRFIVDLYAPALRLVVEVDGGYHDERRDDDARRDRALRSLGCLVLHVGNALVRDDVEAAVESVRAAIVALREGAR